MNALSAPQAAAIPRLMLIDDNEIDHMLCARIVRRSGLVGDLVAYVDAEEALAHLRDPASPPVDAILLDINMPRMNGFEFLEAATGELGTRFARVVIVMLTTSLDPKDMQRSDRCALVRDYFNKPLLVDHLHKLAELLAEETATGVRATEC